MIFVLAMAFAAQTVDPGQIMAGPAFETFAKRTERVCSAKHLRAITYGDLSGLQEVYTASLSSAKKAALNKANKGGKGCADSDGLSCSVGQMLDAMDRADLLKPFADFACAQGR